MPAMSIAVPETIYPSDNELGIPLLDVDMQAERVEAPLHVWGQVSARSRATRAWLFYCDDYKFATLWKNPGLLVRTECGYAGEVNYSLSSSTPAAVAHWETYRKRWLARFWQESGVRTLVDLNVPQEWDELNLLGVPRGWRAYCTRAADYELDRLMAQAELAAERSGTEDLLFVVYGGGQEVQEACGDRGWTWIRKGVSIRRESLWDEEEEAPVGPVAAEAVVDLPEPH